jgi:hypothetical protein
MGVLILEMFVSNERYGFSEPENIPRFLHLRSHFADTYSISASEGLATTVVGYLKVLKHTLFLRIFIVLSLAIFVQYIYEMVPNILNGPVYIVHDIS